MKTTILLFACGLLVASTASALAEVHYVDVNSTNATPPYTNWTTAATNIQDAVDAAVAGDEILVTNGVYSPVYVRKPLSLRSINGPQFTTVHGGGSCVYLTNNATLSGFTLTNGYGPAGCGVNCASTNAVVSNCVITGNRASVTVSSSFSIYGGGAIGGTLNNCTLISNSISATLYQNSSYSTVAVGGGGAAFCTLNNCTLSGNSASAVSYDPNQAGSYALAQGGGAFYCTLNNCALGGNSVGARPLVGNGNYDDSFLAQGGGTYSCTRNNCISRGNTYWAYQLGNYRAFCEDGCSPDSLFVDWASGNLRLQSNSPCINAGNNAYAVGSTDLDGSLRIVGGTVDIGAYEFQAPASTISYAWLQQFNLPINPATDTADPDGDGVDNYHEWLAHSDPTNRFSFPPLLTLIPYGPDVILTWPTNAVGFTLQSTTNPASPSAWATNSPAPIVIGGQNVIINPLTGPQQFYRLSL